MVPQINYEPFADIALQRVQQNINRALRQLKGLLDDTNTALAALTVIVSGHTDELSAHQTEIDNLLAANIISDWTDLTDYGADWGLGTGAPGWYIDREVVRFRGSIINSVIGGSPSTAFTLPVAARPGEDNYFAVPTYDDLDAPTTFAMGTIKISSLTGDVTFNGFPAANTIVGLYGLSFRITPQ